MPVIDLGSVVGPAGPQGATGATGERGVQGLPGPNQLTTLTSTPLAGVIVGENGVVGARQIDAVPTADSTGFATSGGVYTALELKANQTQLAPIENGSTASIAYAVGERFCWNGLLYRATSAISSGDTFTPGTNCEARFAGTDLAWQITTTTAPVTANQETNISITPPDGYTRGVFIGISGNSSWNTINVLAVASTNRRYPDRVRVISSVAQNVLVSIMWLK